MSRRGISVALALLGALAFCTNAAPKSLDLITNETLKSYTTNEVELGAPSLPVTSKVLYREALGLLKKGDKEGAARKLELAASLTGDYAAPLFTLAKIEFLEADPGFLPHLIEGLRRSFTSYPSQAILAANLAALLIVSLAGALFATLVALLVKYWASIDHKVVETYSRKFSAAPPRWIIALFCAALFCMRLGTALYIAVLTIALWPFLARKEKGAVVIGTAFLAAASFIAPYSNCLAPAVDPESITNRLALVNERGVNEEFTKRIRGIDQDRFRAHRDFALGTMMYRLGLYDEAQKYLLDAVSVRPDFAPAFVNLGNIYFMQGDYDKALAGYQSAVELDSTSAVAHYNIGQTYIKKMLFDPSGVWLEKANMLGIEAYRSAHPATGLRNPPVYEEGFKPKALWTIARAESSSRKTVFMGEILRPFFLFPFQWLWALLVAGLAAAMIVARKLPRAWKIARCDNCCRETCSDCEDTQTGIRLCRDCAEVIGGLSSIKVMEALLRNTRLKVFAGKHQAHRWKAMFFPGIAHVYHGRITAGFFVSFVSSAAVALLIWHGLYFKDPRSTSLGEPIWEALAPMAALAAFYLLSHFVRPPQELRNYYVFPMELRMRDQNKGKVNVEEPSDLWMTPRSEKASEPRREPAPARAPEPPKAPKAAKARRAPSPPDWGEVPEFGNDLDVENRPKPRKAPEPQRGSDPNKSFLEEIKKGSKWH